MSDLRRAITLKGLTMIAVGACIGSGIFLTPAQSMNALQHHGFVLLTWFIGGVVTCMGALSFSELGAQFPKAGGVYTYIKEAYGPLAGFLYGWIILLIVNTGALAALSMALADYLNFFIPISENNKIYLSLFVIWSLTIINIFGVNISQIFAQLFTGIKLIAIIFIIAIGFWFSKDFNHEITFNLLKNTPDNVVQSMLIAFVGVFWSMGGWHHATYLAGEVKNAQSTVPKAMIIGTLIVTIVYILVIISYMLLLPQGLMESSSRIAGDSLSQAISWGGKFVTITISISIIGTIGIYTMTAPRIYYAMAKDKVFFNFLADVSTKYGTPYKAMLFQAFWSSIIIVVWRSFIKIITFVTFMDIVFMALATTTVFIFRRKNYFNSTYRMKLYPLPPLIYLIVSLAFVFYTLTSLNIESWVGVGLLSLGIPVFMYFRKQNSSEN